MFTKTIHISSLEEAKEFVNVTAKYEDIFMRIRVDNYEIDAHSIVGVLSIVDSESNAVLTANLPDDDEEFLSLIKPFLVE